MTPFCARNWNDAVTIAVDYAFVNSGFMMGPAKEIRDMFEWASIHAVNISAAVQSTINTWPGVSAPQMEVHADVLRPPVAPTLLCASVGTGMQLLGMAVISIICAMLGFLSPANRGGLLTATLLLFVLMGIPSGYFSASMYRTMKANNWKLNTILAAFLYPGLVFAIFLFSVYSVFTVLLAVFRNDLIKEPSLDPEDPNLAPTPDADMPPDPK